MTLDRDQIAAVLDIFDGVSAIHNPDLSARERRLSAMETAIATAISVVAQGEAEAVSVKPLEWKNGALGEERAMGLDFRYKVSASVAKPGKTYLVVDGCVRDHLYETREAAKAAAQADYEQRIRSCLVAAPAPVPDAVERLRHIQRQIANCRVPVQDDGAFEAACAAIASNKPVGDGYVLVPDAIEPVWGALLAMVRDIHAAQDNLTSDEWQTAEKVLADLTSIMNQRKVTASGKEGV